MFINVSNIKFRKKRGFTLLEMIVSLGIFSVVAVIAVGSLVRITSLNKQAQSTSMAVYNINHIFESISREMRFGFDFHCFAGKINWTSAQLSTLSSHSCPSGTATIGVIFHSAKIGPGGSCQLAYAYWFVRESSSPGSPREYSIKKDQQTDCNDDLNYGDAVSLIDTANVTLDDRLNFSVTVGSDQYSWVAMRIAGYTGKKEREKNYFDLRTGISQRISDIN